MSGIQTSAVLEAVVIPSNAPRSELTGWNMSGTIFTSRRTWPRRRKMAVVTSASSQKGTLFLSPAAFFLEVHLDPVTTFSVQFTGDFRSGSNSTVRLHLRDGSLPLDSFRAVRVPATEAVGQKAAVSR